MERCLLSVANERRLILLHPPTCARGGCLVREKEGRGRDGGKEGRRGGQTGNVLGTAKHIVLIELAR